MKKVLLSGVFFCCLTLFGQKTVQFSDPLPPEYNLVSHVDKQYFGKYKSTLSATTYLFDESGVSIVSTIVAYITRAQLRESSTLQVRNGYLFGIKANDSLPCVLEEERYYYGMEHKQIIIGSGSNNQLTKLDSKNYLVNFLEGTYFEPSLFSFENGGLKVIHGDLAQQPAFSRLLVTNTIQQYGVSVDILSPSAAQWPELRSILFKGEPLNYLKEVD